MNITTGSNKEAKEVVKEKLKEENKRIATGSPVELVNATLGWANCKQGDFGIVISRNPTNGYSVYVPRVQYIWNCV